MSNNNQQLSWFERRRAHYKEYRRKYRERRKVEDPEWNRKEAERKRIARLKESTQQKEKRAQKDRARKRERRLKLSPCAFGYSKAPTRGVIKGIRTLSQFARDECYGVVETRALEAMKDIMPPYTAIEIRGLMYENLDRELQRQYTYIRNPNHPDFEGIVTFTAKSWVL